MSEAGLAGVLDDLLAARLHLGTSGRYFTDFGDDPGRLADDLAAAVTAWIGEQLAGAREDVAETLLTEHIDGDLLVGAGRGHDSEGDDVAIGVARPAEVVWWAADGALGVVARVLGVEVGRDE